MAKSGVAAMKVVKAKTAAQAKAKKNKGTAQLTKASLAKQKADNLDSKMQKLFASSEGLVPETKVNSFLSSLKPDEKQTLWKSFERQRIAEGEEANYKLATSGPGPAGKKNKLLQSWLAGKRSVKSEIYKTVTRDVSVAKTEKYEGIWKPQMEMELKYGKTQLTAMVESGAIQARKMARDKRFWEFRDDIESGSIVRQDNVTGSASSSQAMEKTDFLKFIKASGTAVAVQGQEADDTLGLMDIDEEESEDEDEEKQELLNALGKKGNKAQEEKRMERDLDKMTQVGEDDMPQVKTKLKGMQVAAQQMKDGLMKATVGLNPKLKMHKKALFIASQLSQAFGGGIHLVHVQSC